MTQAMIEVTGLTKDYGTVRAVDQIGFEVRAGEVLGFLGPNGAGKTTTMKILTCYMAPTSGEARVAGYDVYEQSLEVRRRIGYLPEDTPLYREMRVDEYLRFVAELRAIDPEKRSGRIREIAGLCGIGDYLSRTIGELSKGYRQRVGLAQAMIHNPEILILDEPTSGLDPNQIVEIRSLIKEIGKEKTVILSTHILPEVQATCSRVIIIAGGKLVADGTPAELSAREQGHQYQVIIEAPVPASAVQSKLSSLAGVSACESLPASNGAYEFLVHGKSSEDLRRPLFRTAVESNWTLLELSRRAASLEDIFHKLTTRDDAKGENPGQG